MFTSPATRRGETESSEPLLGNANHTVFAVDDEDEEENGSDLDPPKDSTGHVRFQEDVQFIDPPARGPPLRSTIASREAEYELDEIDDLEAHELESTVHIRGPGYVDQSMPLLVGLYESSARRSLDSPGHELAVDLDEIIAKRSSGSSLLGTIANMANSILGAGIIGLPYAVSQAGFIFGLTLLIILCAVTDWTIRLIVINAKLSGRQSYIEIMDHCFGPSGRAAVSFFQFAFAFGGMCAFGIIIGDTIPRVIRSTFPSLITSPFPFSLLASRRFIIFLCTTCVSYPLSLYRDIHKLSRASGLALIGMVIIVLSVLIEGPHVGPELKGDPGKRWSFIGSGVFQAIGVISFAFVCHHNSLLIYGSLNTPTLDRFAKVTHLSTLMSLVACCTLAVSAFWVFTDKTQGNILNNFSPNDTFINIARFCFGLNMFTTLPLELFVCREVVEQFFFSHEPFNMQRHVFFTSSIVLASMLIALITCDLGVMLEITGGASATALAFIFPAACYLKLTAPGGKIDWFDRSKLPAIICSAFGVVVLVISLFLALAKSWTTEGSAKICI